MSPLKITDARAAELDDAVRRATLMLGKSTGVQALVLSGLVAALADRATLLGALRRAVSHLHSWGVDEADHAMLADLRALLASAEGGTK